MFENISSRWSSKQIAIWIAVRDQIITKPETYDQIHVFRTNYGAEANSRCFTVACIAGWAHAASGCKVEHNEVGVLQCAQEALGLTFYERIVVFSAPPVEWPAEFARRFNYEADRVKRSEIVAEYILYILTEGRVGEAFNLP